MEATSVRITRPKRRRDHFGHGVGGADRGTETRSASRIASFTSVEQPSPSFNFSARASGDRRYECNGCLVGQVLAGNDARQRRADQTDADQRDLSKGVLHD